MRAKYIKINSILKFIFFTITLLLSCHITPMADMDYMHLADYPNEEDLTKIKQNLEVAYSLLKDWLDPREREKLIAEQAKWKQQEIAPETFEHLYAAYKARYLELKERILAKEKPFIDQVMTSSPTIDIEKAEEALRDCPTLACNGYKIYFQAQKEKDQEARKKKMEEDLLAFLSKFDSSKKYEKIEDTYLQNALYEILSFYQEVLPSDRIKWGWPEGYPVLTTPLWFLVANPEIINYSTGLWYGQLGIHLIHDSIEMPSNPGFSFDDLYAGHWNQGTMYRSLTSRMTEQFYLLYFIPFAMKLKHYADKSLQNISLERWSFLGPWNYRKYHNFRKAFDVEAKALREYYESQDYLKKMAPFASDCLNADVEHMFSSQVKVASEKAFAVFRKYNQSLENIKRSIKNFKKKDWNAALAYAILSGCNLEILEWLIQSGAEVNAVVDDEPIIIKAADRPEALQFLIAKGANLEGKTVFGKTVLFYAIQSNNFDCVKILVENGANLNAHLIKSVDTHVQVTFDIDLAQVLGYTPLAYSVEYGSDEMTKYLVEKGARLEGVDLNSLKQWFSMGDFFKRDNKQFQKKMDLINSTIKSLASNNG